ncbi:hypothetical protein GZL_05904 [Streptomyces sp. 769]|nr:hypothetical protein GZL_05904 [Streptomyces sp. 769]
MGILCFRHGSDSSPTGCPDGEEHTQIEGVWVRPLGRHVCVTGRQPADRK